MKPLFTNIFGPPGTGKTTVGFTYPPPFRYARFDRRADAVIAAVRAQFGEAAVMETSLIGALFSDNRRAENAKFLGQMEQVATEALQANEGTFFVDGGHRWWEVIQACKLPDLEDPTLTEKEKDKLERKRRLMYGPANAYLDSILLALENSALQIVITHHTRPVFSDRGEETDRVRPDYFKRVPYTATLEVFTVCSRAADVSLPTAQASALQLQQQPQMTRILPAPKFYGLVTICKDDASIEGTMIPNPTFPVLYGMATSQPWPGQTWTPPFLG